MLQVEEINQIERLAGIRHEWGSLFAQTVGASFFHSLDWLEIYWRHFGRDQKLRALLVRDSDQLIGIVPLVIRREKTHVGTIRTLTFPLHDWGSFYGPLGPTPERTLEAGLLHVRKIRRDWDILELRWQGAPGTDPEMAQRAMLAAGFQSFPTVSDQAAVVDLTGTWESYWKSRKGAWLRRFRHAERQLAEQGEITYLRYRPLGSAQGEGSPRWDLYDTCEEIARRSWQSSATDGTTLSHESVRGFFRETHEAAAALGNVDLNLLSIDGVPAAFVYGYHHHGYLYGLRRGFDAARCRQGAGNVLLAYTLRDSFARGDSMYDMGAGSFESKRYFQTRLLPILRFSHFPLPALRTQLLRVKRWWQGHTCPASIAVGCVQEAAADAR